MRIRRALACSFLALLAPESLPGAAIRVDINAANDRRDMISAGSENWTVGGQSEASQSFNGITVSLRPIGGGRIEDAWWKGGIDSGALLTTDGIANPEGGIEVRLRGLAPGAHSLVTYHNAVLQQPLPGAVSVAVTGSRAGPLQVQPSHRVGHDDDAASAFVEFEAQADRESIVVIKPHGAEGVILNGFEIDAPDPALRALKPHPAHDDEHAVENPLLSWNSRKSARAHRVYLGLSRESVASATPGSPEFQGEVTEARYQTEALNPFTDYFWRVDTLHDDARTPTKGQVWRFRIRRLAFPGAEGYGRFARGGRGGRVFEVTTLADAGPGSLREAVEAEGPRTVVFRVGGTIQLKSKLVIRNPYITIAGQTAPGDGICIRGFTFGNYGTHDTIIRYVRIRVGDEAGVTMDGTGFASSDHCIMDHVSVSWSQDEAVSSRGAKNITFQRSIVAQPLNVAGHAKYRPGTGHGYAGSISGNIGSFHHNLLAHAAGRNWSLAGGLNQTGGYAGFLDIRNNVVYNWVHRTNDGGVKALNLVGNVYIPGPATRVFHLLKPDIGSPQDPQQYFVAGNVMEGRDQYLPDNWRNGGVQVDPRAVSLIKLNEPFCESFITEHTAAETYKNVLSDVGANWPRLDSIDQQVIEDVLKRKATFKGSRTGLPGHIDSQRDAGGWPELRGGDAPADSDHDGMPDEWEKQRGLDPANPDDGNQVSPDGYTHLETYLNGIVAARPRAAGAQPAAAAAEPVNR